MKRIITAAVTAAAVGLCGAAAQAESLKIGFPMTAMMQSNSNPQNMSPDPKASIHSRLWVRPRQYS